jgi:hypothetical protein
VSNNIKWKESKINYDELSKLTHQQLMRIENGILAKESGQLRKAAINGGKAVIDKLNKKNKKTNHWRKLGDTKIGVARDKETKKKIKEGTSHSWRTILQYTKDGKLVKKWKNLASIKEELGFNHTNICACCQNRPKYKSAYGFIWKYEN